MDLLLRLKRHPAFGIKTKAIVDCAKQGDPSRVYLQKMWSLWFYL